ncbi:MAG TPA: hypothetical protein VMC79_09345 [Rectinemataceae bacterium]|nr:hypothetical protein [Rectinemataceae bacterium]
MGAAREYRLDYKVPGGKLIRIRIELESGRVRLLRVSGDFFAHPEALFEAAEASLVDCSVEGLPAAAEAAFGSGGLTLFGAAPRDIAKALELAVAGGAP